MLPETKTAAPVEADESMLGEVAAGFLKRASGFRVWLLRGEMGAGKTTFIKALCRQLGVRDEMSSPSFSIVNEYADGAGKPVYHFDFYRVRSEIEASDIGTEDYFYSGAYCFVEWSERIPGLIPARHAEVQLSVKDPQTRTIVLTLHE